MIKIKGLNKYYGNNEVLKEINMEFSRGKGLWHCWREWCRENHLI